MKRWIIPVTYEVYGTVTVAANTLEEAMDIALNDGSIPLPDDPEYLDDTWDLAAHDPEDIRRDYNDGQEDGPEEEPDEDGVELVESFTDSNEFHFVYNPSEAFSWSPTEENEEERDPDEMFGFLFPKEEV